MMTDAEWAHLPEGFLPPEQEHKARLVQLSKHCRAIVELMEYFNPPNLMAWTDDEPGSEWEVFIRRKGSDTQFESSEWTPPEATE